MVSKQCHECFRYLTREEFSQRQWTMQTVNPRCRRCIAKDPIHSVALLQRAKDVIRDLTTEITRLQHQVSQLSVTIAAARREKAGIRILQRHQVEADEMLVQAGYDSAVVEHRQQRELGTTAADADTATATRILD